MDTKTGGPIFISVPEMCREIGIGRSKGWELVRAGKIPSARIGDRVLIPVSELHSWATSLVSRQSAA